MNRQNIEDLVEFRTIRSPDGVNLTDLLTDTPMNSLTLRINQDFAAQADLWSLILRYGSEYPALGALAHELVSATIESRSAA